MNCRQRRLNFYKFLLNKHKQKWNETKLNQDENNKKPFFRRQKK